MTSPAYDVAVIGGGIVGCAAAFELAGRGARVVLLERERLAGGASGAAAGMLAPQSEAHGSGEWFQLLLAARAEHEGLCSRLREETGIDPGYRRDGVLRVAATEDDRRELRQRAEWQHAAGLAAEWLEPREACELEPGLTRELAGALWLPDETQVDAPRLVQALAVAAARQGAEVRQGAPVTAIELAGGRVAGVSTPAGRVTAGAVVLAAGVWSGGIDGLGFSLPLEPVKGQIACGLAEPGLAPRCVIWGQQAYITPKASGRVLLGSTQEPSFDARPTMGAIGGLMQAGARLYSPLAGLPLVDAWAGLRPALPDRLPAIGPVPGIERLFVATGHFRNGILLGPLTGKIVARLIAGEPPGVDLGPYSPGRFLPANG